MPLLVTQIDSCCVFVIQVVNKWVNAMSVSIVFFRTASCFACVWFRKCANSVMHECAGALRMVITLLIGCSRLSCDAFQLRHFWVRVVFFLIIALITVIIRFSSFHCSAYTHKRWQTQAPAHTHFSPVLQYTVMHLSKYTDKRFRKRQQNK